MYIVDVLIEHRTYQLDRTFSYLSDENIQNGIRVKVLFNHKEVIGYVENVTYTKYSVEELEQLHGFKHENILEIIDQTPLLTSELYEVANYLTKVTLAPKISCLSTMLPTLLKPNSKKGVGKKYERFVRVIGKGDFIKTKKQKLCFEFIQKYSQPIKVSELPYSMAILKKLEEVNEIEIFQQEVYRDPYKDMNQKQNWSTLNNDQQSVVDQIISLNCFKIGLLYGVTGSGKTEVYLHIAKKVLDRGKGVMMLVPEIALTPMMVARFKECFGNNVAVLHSRLSEGEKYDEYLRIANQDAMVVVGARSAIFAPIQNLGVIIMDEEHDSSYKQESTPRYHTKDIAKFRAKYHHCPLILASATPLVETYARAKKGIYELYELKKRYNNRDLPAVTIVDMASEVANRNYSVFSNTMKQCIQKCIDQQQQAIILLNRRGYSNYVMCKECGHVIKCPHCDVTLTYHKVNNQLECHYCGYHTHVIHRCPQCKSTYLQTIGYGTQKIEEEIYKEFKGAKVIRMDVDTTRKKDAHTKLLRAFANKEGNILLGTQMIAKGLDFENVTFVGVINADVMLNLPDFRASERTFQLLCQVSGRAGRGRHDGSVVIQTYNPTHYAIVNASRHDYEKFYQKEMEYRQLGNYPPFCRIVSVLIKCKDESKLQHHTNSILSFLKKNIKNAMVLGPSPALVYKVKDDYRMKILIKYKDDSSVYEQLNRLHIHYNKKSSEGISLMIDFNPYQQI